MDPRNIVRFSAKPELLVDSAVDEEVQGRIDSKQKVAHLDLGLWVIRTYISQLTITCKMFPLGKDRPVEARMVDLV